MISVVMTPLMIQRVFPTLLIVLDVMAAVVYFSYGDYRRTVYWLAAATLTACVSY